MSDPLAETGGTWRHCTYLEAHTPEPDLSRSYVQRGTGNLEAPCLRCEREDGQSIAVVCSPGRHLADHTPRAEQGGES